MLWLVEKIETHRKRKADEPGIPESLAEIS